MKRQIRRGTFETNSSSTHSLTMCSDDEFRKWENGEILYDKGNKVFVTIDEIIKDNPDVIDWTDEELVEEYLSTEGIYRFDEFFDRYGRYYDTFVESYITIKGEKVVTFGYYGYN